jgi:hypothetical protein
MMYYRALNQEHSAPYESVRIRSHGCSQQHGQQNAFSFHDLDRYFTFFNASFIVTSGSAFRSLKK